MRGRRLAVLSALVATAGLLGPVAPVEADAPGGTPISCNISAFVVFTPNNPTEGGGSGNGVFGIANVGGSAAPSRVACTGAINGAAVATGSFLFCENDHGPDGTSDAPCGGQPDGFEALYPTANPTSTHVHGVGEFAGDGWVWADETQSDPGTCDVAFNGHGTVPVELKVVMDCGGTTITFPNPGGNISLVLLFDEAADLIHRSDADKSTQPDFQHCTADQQNDTSDHFHEGGTHWYDDTDSEDDPNADERPFCLRAVAMNGTIFGTVDVDVPDPLSGS